MKYLDEIIYGYYVLFKKILPVDIPLYQAVSTVSALMGILLNGVVAIIVAYLFKYLISPYFIIFFGALSLFLLHRVYYKNKRGFQIVDLKTARSKGKVGGQVVLFSVLVFLLGLCSAIFAMPFADEISSGSTPL